MADGQIREMFTRGGRRFCLEKLTYKILALF